MKKIISIIVVFAVILTFSVPVFAGTNTNSSNGETISISKTNITLIKGQTEKISLKGTTKTIKWASSNKKVATVSSKGKIKAKAKGTATITAKVGKKKFSCKVKVETPKISEKKLSLDIGASKTLKIKGTKQKVTWKSSDPDIVSVSKKGTVKAIDEGTAKITATVNGKKYTCKVTVPGLESKVTFEDYVLYDGDILVKIKNNNKINVYVDLIIEFKDKNGKMIQFEDPQVQYVDSGKESYYRVLAPYDEETYERNYDSYTIEIKNVGDESYAVQILDDLEILEKVEGDWGNVQIKIKNNNSQHTMDYVGIVALYYKGDKIIDQVREQVTDLKPGKTDYMEFLPYTEDEITKVELIPVYAVYYND